jgi:hypothetical protein
VKSPKGFGRIYFTFASILAHTVQSNLESIMTKINYLPKTEFTIESLEEYEPPVDLLTLCVISQKPCHCNCFYKLKTYLSLKINLFIPRCPYCTTYFAFRRTGVHPPYFIH